MVRPQLSMFHPDNSPREHVELALKITPSLRDATRANRLCLRTTLPDQISFGSSDIVWIEVNSE